MKQFEVLNTGGHSNLSPNDLFVPRLMYFPDLKLSFGHVQQENVFESLTCVNMMNSDRGRILPSEKIPNHVALQFHLLNIVQALLLDSMLPVSLCQDAFCPVTSGFKCTHPSSCPITFHVTDVLHLLKLMGKNKEEKCALQLIMPLKEQMRLYCCLE